MFEKLQSIVGEQLAIVSYDDHVIKLQTTAGWFMLLSGEKLLEVCSSGDLVDAEITSMVFTVEKGYHKVKIATDTGNLFGIWNKLHGVY